MTMVLQHFRQRAALALAPFFLEATKGDGLLAQETAATLLDDYRPVTPKEIQLAAQIVACGFAALACLRSAMAAKNLAVKDVLALQDAALALDRSAQKATKSLETARKQRQGAAPAKPDSSANWDEAAFNDVMGKALAKMQLADAKIPELVPPTPIRKKPGLRLVASEPMTPHVLRRLGAETGGPQPTKHGPH